MRSTLRAIWFLVPDPFSARHSCKVTLLAGTSIESVAELIVAEVVNGLSFL
ncbi:hypothetical protein Enr13x_49080 [Stieleria neptunia]|uniref:Uncharacterized protein n=1 Tax=Stieleria neptunia TaxID=2527979 RepID=A0A518HW10_9BACT|nr:hypothetical protein Enr13x_49080 [Stieleria neptunia]